MDLKSLVAKVRRHARDFNETIFRKEDIVDFINEAIDRIIQVIPQLQNMSYLLHDDDVVGLLPREYVHLLANYSVARLFSQDERHYEATTFMNEFEVKLAEFQERLSNGEIEIIDPVTGEPIDNNIPVDYVRNDYFFNRRSLNDIDKGVEGVE